MTTHSAERDKEDTGELVDKLFEDENVAERVAQDPLYIFIKNYWRQILMAGAAFAAAFFIYQKFNENYVQGMERGSAVYARTQRVYHELIQSGNELNKAQQELSKAGADKKTELEKNATSAKAKYEELKKQLDASLVALAGERKPYGYLSKIYRGLLAKSEGDIEGVRSALREFNWATIANTESTERFVSELAELVLAKAMLDSEATAMEGRSRLKALADNGAVANVSAGIALVRAAGNPAEKTEAIATLADLKSRHPEQNSLLEEELSDLDQ